MDKQNRRNINVLLYFVHKISEYTFLLFPKIIHKKSQLLSIFWSKIFKLSIFLFLINVSNKFWNYQFSILVNTISLLFFFTNWWATPIRILNLILGTMGEGVVRTYRQPKKMRSQGKFWYNFKWGVGYGCP